MASHDRVVLVSVAVLRYNSDGSGSAKEAITRARLLFRTLNWLAASVGLCVPVARDIRHTASVGSDDYIVVWKHLAA